MKRKNIFVVLMMIAIMVLGGCGGRNTEEITANTDVANSFEAEEKEETETVESSVGTAEQEEVATKPESTDINSLIVEKTDEELDLKQFFYSYEDRTMDNEGEQVFYENLFEAVPDNFITTDNIDIYNINGIRVGYTLKNVELEIFGEYDGWYYFYLDSNKRFAKVEDVEANSKTKEQVKAEEQVIEKASVQENKDKSNKTEEQLPSTPVVTESVEVPVEQPAETVAPADSGKYTPDEAIAVYRSLIEAGGITWNPALKDVTSWGTGWIYLEKGKPEWCASTNLESFSFNDGTGHHTTEYYLEVTGSDDECVYITEWHN